MKISQRGLDLIKSFESYLKPLPDGRCTTYLCPAGVVTIGWGCTKGVKVGDVWTREEAEEGLRRELAKCEAAVLKLVTVDLTQPQFDALVSFVYNCGEGALKVSSILKKLNRGDVAGAAASFSAWNKATVKGRKVELRGLTRRRAAEKALFLSEPEEIEEPEPMPQAVEPPGLSTTGKASALTVGGTTGILGSSALLGDPVGLTSTLVSVKGNAVQLMPSGGFSMQLIGLAVIGIGLIAYLVWANRGRA